MATCDLLHIYLLRHCAVFVSTVYEIMFLTQRRSWRQDDCWPRWEQCRVGPWPRTRRKSPPDLAWPQITDQEALDTPLLGFGHDGHSIVCARLHWRPQLSVGCEIRGHFVSSDNAESLCGGRGENFCWGWRQRLDIDRGVWSLNELVSLSSERLNLVTETFTGMTICQI